MKIEEDFGKALGGFGKALGGFGSSWEGDRPPARPPDRLYILTPDQPRARPHISIIHISYTYYDKGPLERLIGTLYI